MNIRQAMQVGPAKANELFAKLADTSNGAVKTRDKIFSDLKAELELVIDLEERHLFPLLRKHKETRDLVPEAIDSNKEMRARLQELEALPKQDDAFVRKVSELEKGFQRHVRDGRKELLPAVQKVLSDEEANGAAVAIETGHAEAEQAKRDEAEQARANAREERERAERQAAAAEQARREEADRAKAQAREERERAQRRLADLEVAERSREAAGRAAQEAAKEAADTLARTAEAARDGTRRVAEGLTDGARRVAASVQEAAETYRRSARTATLDLQAATAVSQATIGTMAQIRSEGQAWLGRAVDDGVRFSGELLRCRSPQQLAQLQGEFLTNATRNWLGSSARILGLSQAMAGQALPALQARLEAGDTPRSEGNARGR